MIPTEFYLLDRENKIVTLPVNSDNPLKTILIKGNREYIPKDKPRKLRIVLNTSGLKEKQVDIACSSICSEIINKYKNFDAQSLVNNLSTSRSENSINLVLSGFFLKNQEEHRKVLLEFKTKRIDIEQSISEIYDYANYIVQLHRTYTVKGYGELVNITDFLLQGEQLKYLKFNDLMSTWYLYGENDPIKYLN